MLSSRLVALAALLVLPTSSAFAAAVPPSPLHQRIDRLIGANKQFARWVAGPAGDAEFVRRIYLDLTGCIPSSTAARAFLADRSPSKRQALIDRLLSSPEYARHLALVFDVMLMERRADRYVPQAGWIEFLRGSFAANNPWDVISREVLSGDDADPKRRYRAKFFLERDGEPNLVTRDVSRLFLGTNLQCAQCHDHPRVEEYKQEHYYGLFAFVGRSSLLLDRKTCTALLAEKADGDVTFQSVFDPAKVTKSTLPRVPGGPALQGPAAGQGPGVSGRSSARRGVPAAL